MAFGAQDFDAGSEIAMSIRSKRHSIPLISMQLMEKRRTVGWYEYYRDDFDDALLGPEWTEYGTGAGRAIVEADDVLTLAIEAGINGSWWCVSDNNSPRVYQELPTTRPIRIEAKLNAHAVNSFSHAGLMLAYNPIGTGAAPVDPAVAYYIGRYISGIGGWDGIFVVDECGLNGFIQGATWTTMPQWYRIEIDASNNATFYGSPDGITWTNVWGPLAYNYNPLYVGLVCINWQEIGVWIARAAPFEYFSISYYGPYREVVTRDYAPIDVRAPGAFYKGRIKNMSSLKRAIDDKTGLFQVADLSLSLANNDMEFSKLLTSHIFKNQEVAIYHAWTEDPEVDKSHICTMIIEDHSLKGTHFNLKLKDITKKYFTKKVPTEICTEAEFPDIHPDHIGRRKPEILGLAQLSTAYEHPGAIEAVYVDTVGPPYRCLAANGTVTVLANQVWVDDVQKSTPADYTVVYADGHTYIDFGAGEDPGGGTIAFNASGRSIPAWDSANGYIQNLAYIIEYFLRFIMDIPASLVNAPTFAEVATYFTNMGVHESCYLILQDEQDATEILRQMLFTGGIKGFIAKDGKFKIERKDIHNYEITSLDSHIFTQIELLAAPEKQWNLLNAINTVKVRYGYIPWQRTFKSAEETYRDNFFGETMEDDITTPTREYLPV